MKKKTTKTVVKKTKRTVAYGAVAETNPTVDQMTDGSVIWASTKTEALLELSAHWPDAKPKKVVRAIFTTFAV